MTASVESRILSMKFENTQFERGVATTMRTLSKLTSALAFPVNKTGFDAIQDKVSKFHFGPIDSGINGLSAKFIALSTVAVTALSQITRSAISAGTEFAKQFSGMEAMSDGFSEYETKLGSVQTILSNTDGESLRDVTDALDELNTYSDKTIYNFGEMAKNIGTFTAAGVGLDTSVQSIKGIANLAALSGSTSQQASSAMYQLSQAIAAGKVSLVDWNSVVNAGMGGKVFQEALINTAVAMGKIEESAVSVDKATGRMLVNGKSFRESISGGESWLTSDALTNTLAQFSGDLTRLELKQQGFNKQQIDDIRKRAREATAAATKVKTFTQLVGTVRETMGSGWAKSWELIIGDFQQARKLWTGVNNVISGIFDKQAKNRNRVLSWWAKYGGRDDLLEGLGNIWKALSGVIGPIKDAFREIFPRTTARELADATEAFRKFTESLIVSDETGERIKNTFKGVFAIFGIGWEIFKGIVRYVFDFFAILSGGGPSILSITGGFGEMLTKLHEFLVEGGKIEAFFDALIDARRAVLEPIVNVLSALVELAVDLVGSGLDSAFDWLKNLDWGPLQSLLGGVSGIGSNLGGTLSGGFASFFNSIAEGIRNIDVDLEGFGGTISAVFDTIKDAATSLDLPGWMGLDDAANDAADTAAGGVDRLKEAPSVLERIGAAFSGFFDRFGGFGEFLKNAASRIGEFFSNLGGWLADGARGMDFQDVLALINTGFFIGFFAMAKSFFGSLKRLSDSAAGVLDQVTENLKTMQADVKSNIVLKIAASVALLAAALVLLAGIDPIALGKSLAAVGLLLVMMKLMVSSFMEIADAKWISKAIATSIQLTGVALAMLGISVAMIALAGAVKILGSMDIASLGKGVGAIAAIMAIMTAATGVLGKTGGGLNMIGMATAMIALAVGLTAIAGAIKLYSAIDGDTVKDGLLKVAAALGVIVLAMALMPPNILVSAGALIIVAAALVIVSNALKSLSEISGGGMFKALVSLAIALTMLAVAMAAMEVGLPGAAALLVMGFALQQLAKGIQKFADISTGGFFKAMGLMIVTFGVLAGAAILLAPVVPVLIGFSIALALFGAAAFLAGGGAMLLAAGLAALAASGTAGFAVITGIITTILEMLPLFIQQLGLALEAAAKVVIEAGPDVVEAMLVIMEELLRAVVEMAPELGDALVALILTAIKVVRETAPDLIDLGVWMIIQLAEGLIRNMGDIAETAVRLVETFVREAGSRENIRRLAEAALQFIINFLNGLADAIDAKAEALGRAGGRIIKAIANGAKDAIGAALDEVFGELKNQLAFKIADLANDIPGIGALVPDVDGGKALPPADVNPNTQDDLKDLLDPNKGKAPRGRTSRRGGVAESLKAEVEGLDDFRPTITPVLDLSEVEKEAKNVNPMLNSRVSYRGASDVSRADREMREEMLRALEKAESEPREIKFEQNNYSPKALSPVEINRRTRSQLAMAKEALDAR